jgi:hypothetical protein
MKFHFDYQNLTPVEQSARKFVPFYAWMRFNTPLQFEMLMKAPQKYRGIARFKNAASGGEESEFQPDWWQGQDVWETRFENGSGERMGVSVGLPYADMNLGKNTVTMLGPAATLFNLGANYDPFRGRKISEFKGETAPALTIGGKEIQAPAKVAYAIQNLLPVTKRYGADLSAEISQFLSGDNSKGAGYKLLGKAVGVKLMPLVKEQEDKQRVYRLMRLLRDYKQFREQEAGE